MAAGSDLQQSKFKFFSLGMIAQDIAEDSFEVQVFPMEITTSGGGDLNEPPRNATDSVDAKGENSSVVVDKGKVVTATWVPIGASNRITPPNVCKGETVMLYNHAGTDQYYWTTMDNEMDLRKNEKATFFFSNKPGIASDGLLEKSYYFTIDCINKFIRLFTNKNDGEYTTWEVKIETDKGLLFIEDGKGNRVEIDSQKDKLTITTLKDVEINTKNATVNASDSATIKTNVCTIDSSQCNIN